MRKLVVLGLAALVVLAVLLPVLHSTTSTTSSRGGRVFKYTAIMNTQKEPEDDPWAYAAHGLFVAAGSTDMGGTDLLLMTSAGSFSSSSITVSATASSGPEPWVTSVRIVSTFSFASTTTAEVRVEWSASGGHPRMFIPSRTYSAGVTYRWFMQINMYNTSTLKVMPILPASSRRLYHFAPLATTCSFTGGASQTGLSLSISRATHNTTHVRWTATITFTGSEWNNRHVTSCTVQVSDWNVINNLNSMFGTSYSTFWILYVAPGITVLTGDSIVVEVWIVAPANI